MEHFVTILMAVCLAAAVTFYLTGLEPAQLVKGWFAKLANGERLSDEAKIGWRSWLAPVYREARGASKKLDESDARTAVVEKKLRELEFMQHFILGSLVEGILVVNEQHKVTLVNSEFLNIFQLQQSPLQQTVREIMGDTELDDLIKKVFRSAKVHNGRINSRHASAGRPPSFEVSAIPVRVSETKVSAVVLLFLPPPDRPRMVQLLKNHSEKINQLADSWMVRGGVWLRSSIADLPEVAPLGGEPVEPRQGETSSEILKT